MDIRRIEQLRTLEEDLGYIFEQPKLLNQALVHKSHANEAQGEIVDNERLEYLGDSVLGLGVARLLYDVEPLLNEGDMSRIRAYLVKEETLAQIAKTIDLGPHLLLGKGEARQGGAEKPSILSDAFEAHVVAIYLDGGFEIAFRFIESIYQPVIDSAGVEMIELDYKTRLQEYCQARYKKAPTYKHLGAEGPDHDRAFTLQVPMVKRSLAKGRGRSKKEAEQDAAEHAMRFFE